MRYIQTIELAASEFSEPLALELSKTQLDKNNTPCKSVCIFQLVDKNK